MEGFLCDDDIFGLGAMDQDDDWDAIFQDGSEKQKAESDEEEDDDDDVLQHVAGQEEPLKEKEQESFAERMLRAQRTAMVMSVEAVFAHLAERSGGDVGVTVRLVNGNISQKVTERSPGKDCLWLVQSKSHTHTKNTVAVEVAVEVDGIPVLRTVSATAAGAPGEGDRTLHAMH